MVAASLTFITGNAHKAEQLQMWLGVPIAHLALSLDEIQSVDVVEVAKHKAQQAFARLQKPVLVEDVELVFNAWQPLPGPLIKWFQLGGHERLCRMLDGFDDRSAYARVVYVLFDGQKVRVFEGRTDGCIADRPRGHSGFGFDPIFIPDGHDYTRAELDEAAYAETSPRKQAIDALRLFLDS